MREMKIALLSIPASIQYALSEFQKE